MTRDGASGLPTSLLCETHSSGATRREKPPLLTAPVRLKVSSTVVGNWGPTTPAGLDRVDFIVVSVVALEGDLLTTRRVGRVAVVRGVVGDWLPTIPAGFDRIDLFVASGVVGKCYPLAAGRRCRRDPRWMGARGLR